MHSFSLSHIVRKEKISMIHTRGSNLSRSCKKMSRWIDMLEAIGKNAWEENWAGSQRRWGDVSASSADLNLAKERGKMEDLTSVVWRQFNGTDWGWGDRVPQAKSSARGVVYLMKQRNCHSSILSTQSLAGKSQGEITLLYMQGRNQRTTVEAIGQIRLTAAGNLRGIYFHLPQYIGMHFQ